MEELLSIKNEEAVTTSLIVAEKFHKRHDKLVSEIERKYSSLIKGYVQNGGAKFFMKSTYENRGKNYPMYYMTRDGYSLLVMGFTGKEALEWKLKFIEAFNTMESILNEKKSDAWIETRRYGKITRKSETDIIQKLIEYAKEQGSKNYGKLYVVYSNLANKIAEIKDRDMATIRQLNNLELIERIILFEIDNGMVAGLDYHEIYQRCKQAVEHFSEFTNLNVPLIQG